MSDQTTNVGDVQTQATSSAEMETLRSELKEARGLAFQQSVELQALREQLNELAEKSRRNLSTGLEFVSRISHEVRSPLNAILGHAELLLESALEGASGDPHHGSCGESRGDVETCPPAIPAESSPITPSASPSHPEQASDRVPDNRSVSTIPWLRVIQRNSSRLITTLEDLEELVRLEAGRVAVAGEYASPTLEMYDLVEWLGPLAHRKGLTIEVGYQGPIPVRIRTDREKLRRILINLVGNAIKYTDQGRIGITVTMEGSPWDQSPRLAISVEDSGMGISREWQAHLFHSPWADTQMAPAPDGTRRAAGTGLGLSVSRHLARLLGGDLTVTSELGRGSTFRLTIGTGPLDGVRMIGHLAADREDEDAPRPSPRETAARVRLSARVLVVEDGVDNQRLLGMILGRAGATVELAENGRAGVERAVKALHAGQPFDLVLMDIQMPELDGYEATREMRMRGVSQPILALTAHAMAGDRDRCLEAGCDDYLTKPVDRDVLVQTLGRWLDEARRG